MIEELLIKRRGVEFRMKKTTDLQEWGELVKRNNELSMKIQSRLDRENPKKFSGIETLIVPKIK